MKGGEAVRPTGTRRMQGDRPRTLAAAGILGLGAALLTTSAGFSPVAMATPSGLARSHGTGLQFTAKTVRLTAGDLTALTSISADGSTFKFSVRTGNIAKLRPGKVLLIPGVAVRDVVKVTNKNQGLVAQTAPAALTDLVWSGQISWSTPVNYASALVTSKSTVSPQTLGQSPSLTLKGKVEGYEYSMKFTLGGPNVQVTIELTRSQPVNLTAAVQGTLNNFVSKGAIQVSKGQVKSSAVSEKGLSGRFTLSYEVKAASGLGTGGQYLLSLPGELRIPIIVDGIPFFIGLKVSYFVGVGFSQKNQAISGSYTINYSGSSGFSFASDGVTSPSGAVKEVAKILLDKANAVSNGPISLVIGAQVPRIEFGLGVKGASAGAYVNLVASTAVKVGGQGGSTGGCDARALTVEATTGVEARIFGLGISTSPFTLYNKEIQLSYPKGCGKV